ncbi:5-methyltetrahydropteroyltriglutamate--homocysteine S-methyltransferase [Clostridium sp. BJN0001]|uniref:5-methyltetrahydropteroyltriglutamate-- homocysteine S-methyltransferase n=1 Tax=Clostridium sp. BJN0001 TaxID=2930219 RepID=UPI001FD46AC4|nr:5-methyltetrahydropteroyltriglutamate--homocysteine S-methyltransferase [Clostridium sp. BJN0001]
MLKTTISGYPRIGRKRELKFATEKYFKEQITKEEFLKTSQNLRKEYFMIQKNKGIDIIPVNDFSYYDNILDTAYMLNVIPKRYKDLNLDNLDTYFAMARGYQKDGNDVTALAMKKWFNTNYHYIVPEIDDYTEFKLNDTKIFDLYDEAKKLDINAKPVIIGPFTFLKLSKINTKRSFEDLLDSLADVYSNIFDKLDEKGASYVQIEEPELVKDITDDEFKLFKSVYSKIFKKKYKFESILQTYFGDIRDIYKNISELQFDIIALDFVEGKETLNLIRKYGFPKNKKLIAGIINGKNIWVNDYKKSIEVLKEIEKNIDRDRIILGTSCSLLHVPYTVKNETKLADEYKESMAFAEEKLDELKEIKILEDNKDYENSSEFVANGLILKRKRENKLCFLKEVREKIKNLKPSDFRRKESFDTRRDFQKEEFNLPLLKTTTIGSFPQTAEIKNERKKFRNGIIKEGEYNNFLKKKIDEVIKFQEDIGLDVLVHGEYERTDMVEYFGKLLQGFLFTENGWVQSYGTRGVKPPIIYGDIKRVEPMTVKWIKYAQEKTEKPVKGMLTGPVTILNWSFKREDIDIKSIMYQIGIAIGEEVLDLEKNGIKIIQIDEAALREKLPLRKSDWQKEYLDFAIPAFRLTNAKVKKSTQIHTHMCYSEFNDIIKAIDDMDADVISIEAARSDFSILDFLKENNFRLEIGPGVYDIHSPRVPSEEEIEDAIKIMLSKIDADKLWINPDCGLKTRGTEETIKSLKNLVNAAKKIREEL